MASADARPGERFSLVFHALIGLLNDPPGTRTKLKNPFNVSSAAPARHQRRSLRAAIFICKNRGVTHNQIVRSFMQNLVIHQQRKVCETVNRISACVEDW